MAAPDQDTILHVLSRCEVCQAGQVGTRVCVEKGHMVTVASVKRSVSGVNLVDPYTGQEVDARYRLMLKPGESLNMISANAVIDGEVKFAPGTIFQQPPNTKSQTLLGCFRVGVPLDDFVLGGERSGRKDKVTKRERDTAHKDGGMHLDERQAKRHTLSPPSPGQLSRRQGSTDAIAAAAAAAAALNASVSSSSVIAAKKEQESHALALSRSEAAAAAGESGLTVQNFTLRDSRSDEENREQSPPARKEGREGTRSSTATGAGVAAAVAGNGGVQMRHGGMQDPALLLMALANADAPTTHTADPATLGAEDGDSASLLAELVAAEEELKSSFENHLKFLAQAELTKKAEMEAFQRAGELYLQNLQRSRAATTEHALALRKSFLEKRHRITKLRMEEVERERERNRLESHRREVRLKAEKEALSAACELEAAKLGSAWADVETAGALNTASEESTIDIGGDGPDAASGVPTAELSPAAAGTAAVAHAAASAPLG